MLTVIDKAKMFREIVNEMADLYEKKNANYGDSFGQLFDALGPISGLVPLHNKLDRATSLIKGDKNNFESLEDTFKDLACYAIMNLIEMKVRNQKIISKGILTVTDENKTEEKLDLPTFNLNDGKWYYQGLLADGWCYNKDGLMTGKGYKDGQCIHDMVLRNYDTTPHHFIPNDALTTKPAIYNKWIDTTPHNPDTITSPKNPCLDCPWNNQLWIDGSHLYVGDTPCQWCEHGSKLTCKGDTTYHTSTVPYNDLIATHTSYLKETVEPTQTTTTEVVAEQPKEKPVQVFKPIKKKK